MDFVELVEQKSDAQLIEALREPEEWAQGALIAARVELARRGVPLPLEPATKQDGSWLHWLGFAAVLGALAAGAALLGLGPRSTGAFLLPALACMAMALRRRASRASTAQ